MAFDYQALRERTERLLDETVDSGDKALLLNAFTAALDEVLDWHPKRESTTLAGDGSTKTFTLPADFFEVHAILDPDSQAPLPPTSFQAEYAFGDKAAKNSWVLFPEASITFAKALSGDTLMYYLATWTKPTDPNDDAFVFDTPDWMEVPLALYATAYYLTPDAVSAATIRQFGTRVDSGNPEHNPLADRVLFLLKRFEAEMSRRPKVSRTGVS